MGLRTYPLRRREDYCRAKPFWTLLKEFNYAQKHLVRIYLSKAFYQLGPSVHHSEELISSIHWNV
jgi:hypothetical protein